MALATRCPDCNSTFRVVADQLKLRGGLVRCGHCRHVFDAISTLTYVDDQAIASVAEGTAAARSAQAVQAAQAAQVARGARRSEAAPGPAMEAAVGTDVGTHVQAAAGPAIATAPESGADADADMAPGHPDRAAADTTEPHPADATGDDSALAGGAAATSDDATPSTAAADAAASSGRDAAEDAAESGAEGAAEIAEARAATRAAAAENGVARLARHLRDIGAIDAGAPDTTGASARASRASATPVSRPSSTGGPATRGEATAEPPSRHGADRPTVPGPRRGRGRTRVVEADDALEPSPPTIMAEAPLPRILGADTVAEDALLAEDAAAPGATATAATSAAPAPATARTSHDDRPAFLRTGRAPRFSVVFGGGSVLLAVLLAAQLAVGLRTELVSRWPGTRSTLVGLCAAFSCNVGWPTRSDLLAVVGTELQSIPNTDVLELTAVVRNRAGFTVALPAIEVTLTDTQGRAIARKIFAPVDYLAAAGEPSSRIDEGLGGGSDYTVKIAFEARGMTAVGFVVYPFYL